MTRSVEVKTRKDRRLEVAQVERGQAYRVLASTSTLLWDEIACLVSCMRLRCCEASCEAKTWPTSDFQRLEDRHRFDVQYDVRVPQEQPYVNADKKDRPELSLYATPRCIACLGQAGRG
jgi:hypothetical protein